MGEKIEFPLNDEVYLKNAVKHIRQNEYERAIEYIEKISETNQSHFINRLHTMALFSLERYKDAYEIAVQQKDLYLEDDFQIFMFLMVLIKNHKFIEVEAILQQNRSDTRRAQDWENIEYELNLERELVDFEIEMKKRKTKRNLHNLQNLSMHEQSQIIQDAQVLSLEELQEFAQPIFLNPFINGHLQRAFLELLIELRDDNTYLFNWFNQDKKICPKDLTPFARLPILERIDQELDKRLEKNPSIKELINNEIIHDLLLLFPFVEETITDLDYWIESYVSLFDEPTKKIAPTTSEQETLSKWMIKLNRISSRKM